jgi:hypothetical protein
MNCRRLVAGSTFAGMQMMLFFPCYANGLPGAQTAPISPHNATVQSHTVTGGTIQPHSSSTPAPLHGSTTTVAPATSHWVPMPSHAAATVSTSSSTITVQGHPPAINHWTPPNVPAANSSLQTGLTHMPPGVTVTYWLDSARS